MFINTYRAIKSVDKNLRVGGPATAQLAWLDVLVERAVEAECPPDFVSSHLYPTDPYIPHERDSFYEAISDAAKVVQRSAKKSSIAAPPLIITEFNCGLGIDCADAPYAASFIAYHAMNAQRSREAVPIQSYWTFSDIFEEQGQQASEFSQAFGARSIHGIAKPGINTHVSLHVCTFM